MSHYSSTFQPLVGVTARRGHSPMTTEDANEAAFVQQQNGRRGHDNDDEGECFDCDGPGEIWGLQLTYSKNNSPYLVPIEAANEELNLDQVA